ncbi:MAG: hypothetical protein HC930_12100 [Hydrococcus sp. SU_1_0]|nr:hypothetical protein [Hydrococcus sp. SU_1_0]
MSPRSSYQASEPEDKQINHIVTDKDCNTYNGSSILTPYAAVALEQKLEELTKLEAELAKKDPNQTKDTIANPVYTAIVKCEENLDPNKRKNRDRSLKPISGREFLIIINFMPRRLRSMRLIF